jgi:UDPglucose 6-dehydrogenase
MVRMVLKRIFLIWMGISVSIIATAELNQKGAIGKRFLKEHKDKQVIAIIGTGYVGLVTGAGLAEFGNQVICADIDAQKIVRLRRNVIPIYEPGLEELVMHNVDRGRLSFTYDVEQAIAEADIIFIAVNTPMGANGAANMHDLESVIQMIIKVHHKYQIIVTKSTVPIGTGAKIKQLLLDSGLKRDDFDIVSNPEFLREGSAVQDFLKPDRIVIGTDSRSALEIMCSIYDSLLKNNVPYIFTNIVSAEMIKYATNAFLATKISLINEIANLCDKTNADVKTVAYAMGLDHRISPQFLNPGPGFGGSCFLKDAQALLSIAKKYNVQLHTVNAALAANKTQQLIPIKKMLRLLHQRYEKNALKGKTIAVLGLAFKANTDDIRHSPACTVVRELIQLGATVQCYDPVAMHNAAKEISEVIYCDDLYSAVKNADAVIVMTEWDEFKKINWEWVATLMRQKIVIDARNILDPAQLQALNFVGDAIGQSYLYKSKKKNGKVVMPMYRMVAV